MIFYSDLYNHLSRTPKRGMEYQVLNELSDNHPKRSDSSCIKYTRFLFEFDERTIEDQKNIMEMNRDILVRAVFSGSKSIHMIVQFEDKYSDLCKRWYKKIWKWLEKNYFNGADSKCTNPSRLTRAPDVLRRDTGRIQETLYSNPTNYISNYKEILRKLSIAQIDWIKEEKEEEGAREIYRIKSKFLQSTDHNGMCREYNNVKRYLSTPFTKLRGNINSASWFYAALCTCIQYNDNQTLEEVKDKARRERWSQHEIEHTEKNAREAVNKKKK